jgi:prophage regulatory protein
MQPIPATTAHERRPRRVAVQTLDSLKIPEALLKISTVTAVTGLSASSIRRRMAAGQFPQPVRDGARCTRWVAQSVTDWLRAKGAK